MRRTITISVSDAMHSLIYEGMRSNSYCTVSEYIRFLVRRDQMPYTARQDNRMTRPPRTMNQCMEDACHEIETEREVLGDK